MVSYCSDDIIFHWSDAGDIGRLSCAGALGDGPVFLGARRGDADTTGYSGFRASASTNVSQVRQYSRSSFSSEGSMIASLLSVSSPQVGQVASPLMP